MGALRSYGNALADVAFGPSNFAMIERYLSDPAYAAQVDAERDQWRRDTNALIDRGMAPLNRLQAERWAREEASASSNVIEEKRA